MSENELVRPRSKRLRSIVDASPPRRVSKVAILFSVCIGMLAGIGFFTFGYGRGASYLSNDPQTCVNCKGFHASQEAARVLAESVDYARQAIAKCYQLPGSKTEQ